MNRYRSERALLHEVLEDTDVATFKERLLQDCYRHLQGPRRVRQWIATMATAAAVLLVVTLWWIHGSDRITDSLDTTPVYLIKAGRPVDPSMYIKTNPSVLEDKLIVRSRPLACLVTAGPLPEDRFIRETRPMQTITDSEMLALFPGTACGFIHTEKGPPRFVFFDPEVAKRYLR